MKYARCSVTLLVFAVGATVSSWAQRPEVKFIADTIVVEADGTYRADPDLASLTFQIFAQDKELRQAYSTASQSMQHIGELASKNGLAKEDISSGALTVRPFYEGDRRKRARSYSVQGEVVLRIRDFSKIGSILDGSVEDGVADFRSLTYSLADEETAKKQAVADAMRRATGRASIALEQRGQKLGALRYMSLDVRQLYGVVEDQTASFAAVEVDALKEGVFNHRKALPAPPPPPPPQPEKMAFNATVQCAFQIE